MNFFEYDAGKTYSNISFSVEDACIHLEVILQIRF